MKKATIIIPVYNQERTFEEKIQPIISNVSDEYEIIVVNDGSSDETKEVIKKISDKKNITVFHLAQNSGAGNARNIGIEHAQGEYVYFFDADDEFVGFDVLNDMYQIAKDNDCLICGGSFAIVREDGQIWTGDRLDRGYTFYKDGLVNSEEYQFDYGFMRFLYNTDFLRINEIKFPMFKRYQDPPFMLEAFLKAGQFYAMKTITYRINAHEKQEWNDKELQGLCDGIANDIQVAREHNLENCYCDNIRRVFADFGRIWHRYAMENCDLILDIKKHALIQQILLPNSDIVGEKELFYKQSGIGYCVGEEQLEIGGVNSIDFNSYFNAFSCFKWKKYTSVRSVSVILELCGDAEITLFHNQILYGGMHSEIIKTYYVCAPRRQFIYLDFGELRDCGNYSFTVTTKDKPVIIYDGFYISNLPCEEQSVKLAIAFTTYKKEEYIQRNLKSILSLNDSRIHTYVIDNASSLDWDSCEQYSIIRNKNVGGAGGFSRAMMQIIDDNDMAGYTYAILMDDDVLIDTRIFSRLCYFLGRLKIEYREAFVGGAMFRKDLHFMQVEAGASWNRGEIHSYGHGLDMRDALTCLKNETEQNVDYNAWWFCVVPIDYIRNDNLPIPLFLFNDDVDFGLRSHSKIIMLNGICTWHDAFESKISAMRLYYENRNRLIVNSVHRLQYSKREMLHNLKQDIIAEVCLYRYSNAKAILAGIEDFLKGPEWLCSLDAEEYNKSIIARNRKMEELDALTCKFDYDWYRICCTIQDCDRIHRWIRILSLNGLLLKENRFIILPLYANRPVQGYRASEILYYDEITNKGYLCKKDWVEIKSCFNEFRKIKRLIEKKYHLAVEQYERMYAYLISREQWEKYLKNSFPEGTDH